MGKISLAKKEIEDCFDVINKLSQKDTGSNRVKGSFSRFPNGYFINDSINAETFLSDTIKEPSKKDSLSKFISSFQFIKKLGTSSFEIFIPSAVLEIKEQVLALKMVNDFLILWTNNFVYKIPASEKALKRLEMIIENIQTINNLKANLNDFFLIPKVIETNDLLLLMSKKCQTLSLENNKITEIDNFLHNYFTKVFQSAEMQDSKYRGLQHGDLHYRNLLIDKKNRLYITDIDLIKANGFPFLDLMHFAVHLIRTIKQQPQYKPLELFLQERSYLFDILVEYNFSKLSEIWLQYYHDDYISLYIQSQIEWYHYNKIASDELEQLENLQQKYNV